MQEQNVLTQVVGTWPVIREWLLTTGVNILITVVVGVVITLVAGYFIRRAWHRADKKAHEPEEVARAKRLKTLLSTLKVALVVVIWVIVAVTVLGQLGVAIGPIIAGLGVVGIAVGFGAQSLIKDFFTGAFIILENQMRVGDIVIIGADGGVVEKMSLRITQIRSLNGHLITIPNGEIAKVENMTMKWSRALVKVGVAYSSDIDQVIEALGKAVQDIKADETYGPELVGEPDIKAIDDFADSSINVAVWINTRPAKQWDVGRMFRRYVKRRFDEAGITIPFPQVTLSPHPELKDLVGATFATTKKPQSGSQG